MKSAFDTIFLRALPAVLFAVIFSAAPVKIMAAMATAGVPRMAMISSIGIGDSRVQESPRAPNPRLLQCRCCTALIPC